MAFSVPPEDWLKAQEENAAGAFLEPVKAAAEEAKDYADQGVKYAGYARKEVGSGQYVRVRQATRFVSTKIQNTAGFSNVVARPNAEKSRFFCTKILIIYRGISTFPMDCRISDVVGTAASTRLQWYPEASGGKIVLDLSDCPREFSGDSFDFYTSATLGASEWIFYELFGWEEDK